MTRKTIEQLVYYELGSLQKYIHLNHIAELFEHFYKFYFAMVGNLVKSMSLTLSAGFNERTIVDPEAVPLSILEVRQANGVEPYYYVPPETLLALKGNINGRVYSYRFTSLEKKFFARAPVAETIELTYKYYVPIDYGNEIPLPEQEIMRFVDLFRVYVYQNIMGRIPLEDKESRNLLNQKVKEINEKWSSSET